MEVDVQPQVSWSQLTVVLFSVCVCVCVCVCIAEADHMEQQAAAEPAEHKAHRQVTDSSLCVWGKMR